jgi:hypothetical protein
MPCSKRMSARQSTTQDCQMRDATGTTLEERVATAIINLACLHSWLCCACGTKTGLGEAGGADWCGAGKLP